MTPLPTWTTAVVCSPTCSTTATGCVSVMPTGMTCATKTRLKVMDPVACDYNPDATDEGECDYCSCAGEGEAGMILLEVHAEHDEGELAD